MTVADGGWAAFAAAEAGEVIGVVAADLLQNMAAENGLIVSEIPVLGLFRPWDAGEEGAGLGWAQQVFCKHFGVNVPDGVAVDMDGVVDVPVRVGVPEGVWVRGGSGAWDPFVQALLNEANPAAKHKELFDDAERARNGVGATRRNRSKCTLL